MRLFKILNKLRLAGQLFQYIIKSITSGKFATKEVFSFFYMWCPRESMPFELKLKSQSNIVIFN